MQLLSSASQQNGATFNGRFLQSNLPGPLEKALKNKFLPASTGQSAISLDTRRLLALPSHLDGLGICDPVTKSAHEHQTSKLVARTLTEVIKDGMQQCDGAFSAAPRAKSAQTAIRKEKDSGGVGDSTIFWEHQFSQI